jgi:hypothetical protein
MKKSELPSFFNYNIDDEFLIDNGLETLQDFFLSWTLRCSEEKYQDINPTLYKYSRKAVYGLLFGINNEKGEFVINSKIDESFKVLKVLTRRQWKKIDLLLELTVVINSEKKHYILNIENKWYANLGEQQLKTYKNFVEEKFGLDRYEIINLFITIDTCRKNYENEKKNCKENNYKFLTVGDIKKCMETKDIVTGNDIFDEYWFYFE